VTGLSSLAHALSAADADSGSEIAAGSVTLDAAVSALQRAVSKFEEAVRSATVASGSDATRLTRLSSNTNTSAVVGAGRAVVEAVVALRTAADADVRGIVDSWLQRSFRSIIPGLEGIARSATTQGEHILVNSLFAPSVLGLMLDLEAEGLLKDVKLMGYGAML
jgi:hypothetical protein